MAVSIVGIEENAKRCVNGWLRIWLMAVWFLTRRELVYIMVPMQRDIDLYSFAHEECDELGVD